jgi:hypothetical protein
LKYHHFLHVAELGSFTWVLYLHMTVPCVTKAKVISHILRLLTFLSQHAPTSWIWIHPVLQITSQVLEPSTCKRFIWLGWVAHGTTPKINICALGGTESCGPNVQLFHNHSCLEALSKWDCSLDHINLKLISIN